MSGTDREAPDVETSPFASLKIWRDKIQADLSGEPDRGPEYKLRLLLEQGKDVEMAVQGCLRDTLFELAEAVHWGLVDAAFAQQQRLSIYNQAAVELNNDKQLCLQLAKEHGLEEAYVREVKRSINRTLADYERVGDLKFALLVWRTNLLRDTSLAVRPEEIEETLREGYYAALRLIGRLTSTSARFWAVQHSSGDVAALLESKKAKVYDAAVQLVQLRLMSIAEQRGLDQSNLDSLFTEVTDPEAVPQIEDEYSDTPERPGRSGVYEPSRDAGKELRVLKESTASENSADTAEAFI